VEVLMENITLSLPSKAEYVSVARLTASVIANNMGFNIEEVEDIKVAVGEACNNAVLHGKCDQDRFNLNFVIDGQIFMVEVRDTGNGFDFEEYTEPDLMNPRENGLGLFIMKSLMDEVEVTSTVEDGTCIKMVKNVVEI